MRALCFLFLAISSLPLFSQKMLQSHEWCAKKYGSYVPTTLLLEDGRSDSIDIIRTVVNLDLMNTPQIKARCLLTVQGKMNGLNEIRLDLEGLTVDSVQGLNLSDWSFSQSGNSLLIDLPQPLNQGVSIDFNVFYHGVPPTDASGWGGYYNTGGYTFNLGVGFAANPHSFGRAPHDCH